MNYKVELVWKAWASFQSTGPKPKWCPLWNFVGVKTVLATSLGSITEYSLAQHKGTGGLFTWIMTLWPSDYRAQTPEKGGIILRPNVRSGKSFIHFLTSPSPTPNSSCGKGSYSLNRHTRVKTSIQNINQCKKIICSERIYVLISLFSKTCFLMNN